jgi:hypothetical protein
MHGGIRSRGRRLALAMGLAIAGLGVFASSAMAFDLIEGTWTREGSTVKFLYEATGGGHFKQTTVSGRVERTNCEPDAQGFHAEKLGEQETSIVGGGTDYTGLTTYRRTSDCSDAGRGETSFHITSTDPSNFRMRYCAAPPGGGPPVVDAAGNPVDPTRCFTLVRVAAPRGPVTAKEVFKDPGKKSRNKRPCGKTRKLKVAVTNPANDPLVSLVIKLNGKVAKRFGDTGFGSKVLVGRQPQKAFTVVVSGVTASGKQLKRTIKYKQCIKRKVGG